MPAITKMASRTMRRAEFRRVCPMRTRELGPMRSNSAVMKILGTTVVFLRFQIKFTLRTVDTVKKSRHIDERRSAFHERHQESRKDLTMLPEQQLQTPAAEQLEPSFLSRR